MEQKGTIKYYKNPLFNISKLTVGPGVLISIASLMIVVSLLIVGALTNDFSVINIFRPTDIAGLIWIGIFGLPISVAASNAQPNIGITDKEIYVGFWWWYIHIPWSDVKRIRKIQNRFATFWLVEMKGLTPFHRLFGLMYMRKYFQSIIIDPKWIEDGPELVELIKNKVGAANIIE